MTGPADLFARCYETGPSDHVDPGYRPEGRFAHMAPVVVGRFPAQGGDGQDVVVLEVRAPARFYEVQVEPGMSSTGRPQVGFRVQTGSGEAMGRLAFAIARAVAEGMLGFQAREVDR